MSNEIPDQELLRRYVRDGSESAFRQLVERHVDLVYGAAYRRLNDQGAAEETAQNAFIALARRAPFLVSHPSLAGWLYHTAANLARQQFRAESRRRVRESAAVQLGSTMHSDPSNPPLASAVDEAMLELRADDREALLLRYFQDKSLREVGDALGVREDAAQKRVTRALEALTKKLGRRGCALPLIAAPAALKGVAHAAPAGLAATVSKAALATGGAATFSGLSLLLARFMMLSNTQATVACVLLAATPVAFEWHAAATARGNREAIRHQLASLQGQIGEQQRSLDQALVRMRSADATLASLREDTSRQQAAASTARARAATNYYKWSDDSDYVRIPKAMISAYTLVKAPKKSPLDASGTEALQQVLGVTPVEALKSLGAFGQLEQDYRKLLQSHAYLTNQAPTNFQVGNAESETLVTHPFGEDGTALENQLRSSLEASLGKERAGVVMQQAEPLFQDEFNDFGKRDRVETVSLNPTGMIMYWKQSSIPGEDFSYNYLNMGLGTNVTDAPEPFRPFLTAQLKKLADQRAAKNP